MLLRLQRLYNCNSRSMKSEGENMSQKPTIYELEKLLNDEEDVPIEILPNGEIRARNTTSSAELQGKKPITMREDLGGEYVKAGTYTKWM